MSSSNYKTRSAMKRYILLAIASIICLTACEQFLDIPQKGVVAYDTFYDGSDESAESALVYCYSTFNTAIVRYASGLYSGYETILNYRGDDIYAAGSNFGDNDFMAWLYDFRYTDDAEAVRIVYKGMYSVIYACNLLLDNFEPTTPVKKRCIAEARVIRAYCNMYLAILFGTPPFVEHVLDAAAKPYNCDKDPDNPISHDDLLRWCAQECIDAVPDLDERQSTADKNGAVKITKGAAYAFAGKALLFCNDYAGVKNNLKKVIDSNKYALVSGPEMVDLFHVKGDASPEKIFEFNVDWDSSISTGTARGHTYGQFINVWGWRNDKFGGFPQELHQTGWGGNNPTGKFARALIENDGLDSYRRKAWIKTYDEVLYDMTYVSDATATTMELKQRDEKRGINDPGGLFAHEGYFHYKRITRAEDLVNRSFSIANPPVMRYAEVLLMYAEACAQTGDNDGLQYLNMIQRRAGSQHISSSLTMEEVKNEKWFEMWEEGCRFIDLVRWGEAAEVLAHNGDAMPAFKDHFFDSNPATRTEIHEGYVDWTDSDIYNKNTEHGFKAGKHELLPFPYSETSINENITQNPGW